MPVASEFSVSYYRKDGENGVIHVAWKKDDPSFFACPNDNRDISRAILANLTQQWDASVLNELGLSNLLGMSIVDTAEALGKQLPRADEFSLTGPELVEILKTF